MTNEVGLAIDERYHLNWEEQEFPMKIEDIRYFELHNPNISVNVFGLDPFRVGKIVGPLYKTKKERSIHINMLFIGDDVRNHYCLVTNLFGLANKQMYQHGRRKEICNCCLLTFTDVQALTQHTMFDCLNVVTNVPEPGTKLKFEDYYKRIRPRSNEKCASNFKSQK